MFTLALNSVPLLVPDCRLGTETRLNKMLPDAYGCVVANRFGNLLDDDADPFDMISGVATDKEKKKKKKKGKEDDDDKKNKQKKPGQKESQKDRRVPVTSSGPEPPPTHKQQARVAPATNPRGDGTEEAQRGTKRAAFGEQRAKQEQEIPSFKTYYNAEHDVGGKGEARAGRGARGGGGHMKNSDDFRLRGKREYERHSGTGISPEEKRGGRGSWNWGAVEDTVCELMEVTPEAPGKPKEPRPADEGENPALEEEDGEMVVQVAVEMSLDEWKALQEVSRPKPEFNIRKAEDQIPSKATVIHKSKRVESPKEIPEEIEDEGNFLRRSVNDITSLLNINFGSLGRPSRGGGRGRGARGGLPSRPERDSPKGDKQDHVLAPNPDDPEDFPALSMGK
ncbi:intracellular hyaluronan-binding protein 4-like [Genypterus blacodes]|uniref:intracellular hyaluronan-binding protein 4-like n=1 Tax=Genypterus blacodes TaxID=154954 RepID=UPI003F7625B6